MQLTMQAVDSRVSDLLIDPNRERWSADERIRWANEAMGAIMTRRPAAFARRIVHTLVAGVYQDLPADSSVLLDVVRNMKADGITSGRPIRRTDRQLLDDSDPDWMTMRPKAEVRQYVYDDRVPKSFFVYPPVVAGTKVELQDAALPADITSMAGTLGIGAEYLEAVVNYVCYRCNSKDSEFANGAIAAAFYQAFEASLGMKTQSQQAASPNQPTNSV